MGRTSKKKQIVKNQSPVTMYSVGIYARLSVDNGEKKNESIETQIEIAKEFLRQHKDMILYECYTDIGKTGTNFEREGFEKMMLDVRTGKIDCIIVKDLSRFGRNHIETGNFIEKIFPFLGVRFIAVTDDFDSMKISSQNESLSVNLKNLANEMYAKDIAQKIKASRKERWEQGSYTGGVAPYGYRAEWIGNKKCLFVEKITSEIVKKIYEQFLSGKNMKEIVTWLYEEKIVRPSEYHKTGQVYCSEDELLQWNKGTVKMVLTNPVYMGSLVQARTSGKDYMMREKHDIESDDWSIKEHTHEAIISEDDFFRAAAKFEKSSVYCNKTGFSKRIPVEEDVFADVLFCGECGERMKRFYSVKVLGSKDRIRYFSYNCSMFNRIDKKKCNSKSIALKTLTDIVKSAIRQEFALSAMRPKELIEANRKEAEQAKIEYQRQMSEIDRQIENITKQGSEDYQKYRMGDIQEKVFRCKRKENDKKINALQKKRIALSEQEMNIDRKTIQKNQFLRALTKGSEKTQLTSEVVKTLIHRIEVYPDQKIKVIFAFQRKEVLPEKEGI